MPHMKATSLQIGRAGLLLFLLLAFSSQSRGSADGGSPDTAPADVAPSLALRLSKAIADGRLMLEIRPRYNLIHESAKPERTKAWTYRATLGWQTAPFHDFRLTAQAIHTDIVGPHTLNDDPAKFFTSEYPLLPDPRGTGVNQLFVDYAGIASSRARIGRQILRIDDQRFISDVDFRQTPQVFDGVTVINNDLPNTEIQVGEYRRMRNVLGVGARLRVSILHLAWNPAQDHSVSAYGYWHNAPATGAQTGFANNAQRIAGIRAEGMIRAGDSAALLYHAEWARQQAIAGGDSRIDAKYHRFGGGFSSGQFGVRMDREVKGSNQGVYGFQTPLTDFYAFNGNALQFTSTPAQGLRDTWLTLKAEHQALDFFAEFHRFQSDFCHQALGREWDANFIYTLLGNLQAKLQFARFRAGAEARYKNDVDKTWLAITYKY